MRQSFSLMLIATTLVFVACQETSQPLGPEPPPLNSTSALTPAVNQPPVADANGPYNGTIGLPVVFDGSGSSDPDGTIISYDWDFGDGSVGTGIAPTHTYAAAGLYTVALTVTDDSGTTDTNGTTANIMGNQPPVADPNGPYSGTMGSPVTFDGSGSFDLDGTIIAYDWDFGDGGTGTGVAPTHSYAAAGLYTVALTVTDDAGNTDTNGTTANIMGNQPPVADPNGPYSGTMGSPVTFDGSGSFDLDGTIIAYDWDFGDGGTGTGVAPTHSYAASGLYTVALTVTDEAGNTDTATTTANIINAAVIDIKPGSGPNCLKDSSKGRVAVAILATPSFDVALVDPSSVQIGGVFAVRWSLKKDVSGDGYVDLLLHFKTKDLMAAGLLYDGSTWVLTGMMGTGSGALPFSGWDVIYLAGGPNCD